MQHSRKILPRKSIQSNGADLINGATVSDKVGIVAEKGYYNLSESSVPTGSNGEAGAGGGLASEIPGGTPSPVATLPAAPPRVLPPAPAPTPVIPPPETPAGVAIASPLPPVANAGPNQVITLPANTAVLDASGSTDPQGSQLSYVWGVAGGPNTPLIDNYANRVVSVSGLIAGTYIFRLSVFNMMGLESDTTVSVVVQPGDNSGTTVNTGATTINAGPTVISTAPIGDSGPGPLGDMGGAGAGGGSGGLTPDVPTESFWQQVIDFAEDNWLLLALAALGTGYLLFGGKNKE